MDYEARCLLLRTRLQAATDELEELETQSREDGEPLEAVRISATKTIVACLAEISLDPTPTGRGGDAWDERVDWLMGMATDGPGLLAEAVAKELAGRLGDDTTDRVVESMRDHDGAVARAVLEIVAGVLSEVADLVRAPFPTPSLR